MRNALLVVAAVLLIGLVWFGRSALGGHFVHDETFMMDTYHVSTLLDVYAGHLARGGPPLWLPEFFGGTPALGFWMYGFLYPGVLLWVLMPPHLAWTWSALLHMALGAGGMYAFVRERRGVPAAAATAALLFAVSEYFVGRAIGGHLNLVWPVAWAPWILWQVTRCARGAPGAGGWLALCAGLGLLSGHVQVWFWLGPAIAIFAVLQARSSARGWSALRPMALGAGLALLLAAVQILPTAELLSVAGKAHNPEELLRDWSAPTQLLAAKLAPGVYGWGSEARWGGRIFDQEALGIAGLGALLLALLGVTRSPLRVFWLVVAAAGGFIALGKFTALTAALMDVPVLSWGRVPARALVLTLLGASVLAGHGVADWLEAGPAARLRRTALWTGGLALAAVLVFLRWSSTLEWPLQTAAGVRTHADVWRAVAGPALALSLLGGGLVAGALLLVRARPRLAALVPTAAVVAALLSGVPPVRSVPADFFDRDWDRILTPEMRAHRVWLVMYRQPYAEPRGVRSLRRLTNVSTRWLMSMDAVPPDHFLWWMDVGIRAQTETRAQARPRELRPAPGTLLPLQFFPPPQRPVGRARLFPGAVAGVSDEDAITRLSSGERAVLLAAPDAAPLAGPQPPLDGGVTVQASADPEEIVLVTDTRADAWLFVSEIYYPGWGAEIDGAAADVERANVAFMAVRVPSGRHRVVLRYRSWTVQVGAWLSFLALVGAGVWAGAGRWRASKS